MSTGDPFQRKVSKLLDKKKYGQCFSFHVFMFSIMLPKRDSGVENENLFENQ